MKSKRKHFAKCFLFCIKAAGRKRAAPWNALIKAALTLQFIRALCKTYIYGDVAQLGERAVRIRKVESSILFVSTIPFRPTGRFFYGKTAFLKAGSMNKAVLFQGSCCFSFSHHQKEYPAIHFLVKEHEKPHFQGIADDVFDEAA